MTSVISTSILERFDQDRWQEVQALVAKYQAEPTIANLCKELSSEKPDYPDLFARGIAHLPAPTQEGGNPSISAYFFLLSEIVRLPDEARKFAHDASRYAGGSDGSNSWYRTFSLDSRLVFKETVWPLLS